MKSEWKETTIEECSTVLGDGLHGTPKYDLNGEYAFINGNNLQNGKIKIKPKTKRVNIEEYKKYKKDLNERTIFVSINGTLGNVAVYNGEKIILGKSACYFNVSENVDVQFMKYVVSTPKFKQYINSIATGTTIKNVSLKQMREYKFFIPNYSEQKKIASILSALDEKIELNQQINNNLEQQAQAIYSNFIKKIEGEYVPISYIIDVRDGTHDSPKSQTEGYSLVTSKHLQSFGVELYSTNKINKVDFDKINERSQVNTGDILLSMIGTVGIISLVIENPVEFAIKNVGLFKTSQNLELVYYVLCHLKSKEIKEHIEMNLAGSTQKYISLTELRKLPILIPTNEEIIMFNNLVKPIFSKIIENIKINRLLIEIRNILLPKLMNGEIDVSNIKI